MLKCCLKDGTEENKEVTLVNPPEVIDLWNRAHVPCIFFRHQEHTTEAAKHTHALYLSPLALYIYVLVWLRAYWKTKQWPPSFTASAAVFILRARPSATIWPSQIWGAAREGLWLNCCSPFPVCPTQCKKQRVRGSSINAGGPHLSNERYCLDRGIGGGGGVSGVLWLFVSTMKWLESLRPWAQAFLLPHRLSKTISLLWAAGEISQKHFTSPKRGKARANHVELERLPHNHECALSDIIKMHWALEHASMGWLCSRGDRALKSEANPFALLLLVLLYDASLDWLWSLLHQHRLKVTTSHSNLTKKCFITSSVYHHILQKNNSQRGFSFSNCKVQRCCASQLLSCSVSFFQCNLHGRSTQANTVFLRFFGWLGNTATSWLIRVKKEGKETALCFHELSLLDKDC